MSPSRSLMILLGWLALVVLTASSGVATPPGAWYAALDKPPLTPPSIAFPIAWTALYLLMALAAWRATLASPCGARWHTLWPFVAQLAAYLAWVSFAAYLNAATWWLNGG
ncbi:tryptophan-rich sensory protein [Halomonas sp.]|uniref:tryptophan-rich sensory protein n=1 Tax=Halomonas sp. TaxID=1486246 RepID=UPI00356B190D